jgi:hypothetical protein
MDFVDCIPKNNINFRIILQKKCTIHKKVVPLHRLILNLSVKANIDSDIKREIVKFRKMHSQL